MDIKEINGCLWNGIIRISMKFVDNAMWILNTIAYINSADFIILDLIMRIYFTYITQMRIINIDFSFVISDL